MELSKRNASETKIIKLINTTSIYIYIYIYVLLIFLLLAVRWNLSLMSHRHIWHTIITSRCWTKSTRGLVHFVMISPQQGIR